MRCQSSAEDESRDRPAATKTWNILDLFWFIWFVASRRGEPSILDLLFLASEMIHGGESKPCLVNIRKMVTEWFLLGCSSINLVISDIDPWPHGSIILLFPNQRKTLLEPSLTIHPRFLNTLPPNQGTQGTGDAQKPPGHRHLLPSLAIFFPQMRCH